MELALMRFKGFTFLCNPLSIEITSENSEAEYNLLYKAQHKEHTGRKCRTVKGKGVICGKDCLEQYAKLYALQAQGGRGILSLPVAEPFEALFTRLTALAEHTPDTVSYSFEFTETSSEKYSPKEIIHRVKSGETLFDIAHIYSVSVDSLVRLNPWVRRPDELKSDEEIKVC